MQLILMTFGFHPEVMPVIRGPNPNNGPGSLHPLTEAMASVQAGPHSALLHLTNRVPLGCFGRAGGCLVQGRIVRKMVKAGTFSKGLNMGSRGHLTKCSVGTCTLPCNGQATPYQSRRSFAWNHIEVCTSIIEVSHCFTLTVG